MFWIRRASTRTDHSRGRACERVSQIQGFSSVSARSHPPIYLLVLTPLSGPAAGSRRLGSFRDPSGAAAANRTEATAHELLLRLREDLMRHPWVAGPATDPAAATTTAAATTDGNITLTSDVATTVDAAVVDDESARLSGLAAAFAAAARNLSECASAAAGGDLGRGRRLPAQIGAEARRLAVGQARNGRWSDELRGCLECGAWPGQGRQTDRGGEGEV